MARKLGRCIQAIGRYNAIVVRPSKDGRYQILDGHSRVESLHALGHKKVSCDVWDIDGDVAGLFIAACNSVRGVSVPELRLGLLFDLMKRFSPTELSGMLSESEAQLAGLLAFEAGDDFGDLDAAGEVDSEWMSTDKASTASAESEEVTMTLRVTKTQYAVIKNLLHDFMRRAKIQDMGKALAQYLLDKAG